MITLVFDEPLKFSAAHYIVNHETCGCIHGHTFFIKDLVFEFSDDAKLNEQGILVDFGNIKDYVKRWDHKFIVPVVHHMFWDALYKTTNMPVKYNLLYVQKTSCESMAKDIKYDLEELAMKESGEKVAVHFRLCEGPGQGVKV